MSSEIDPWMARRRVSAHCDGMRSPLGTSERCTWVDMLVREIGLVLLRAPTQERIASIGQNAGLRHHPRGLAGAAAGAG